MPKKATKVINVLDQDIIATEEYYLNNPNLPKPNATYTYTPEMIEAMKKCSKDIIYFAENFFFINGFNGKEIIKLFDKQKQILKTIQKNKKSLLLTSRQFSKTTLMTIVAVWSAIFFPDQTIAIIANKLSTASEIFNRIRLAFLQMDNWLKGGVIEFNKTFMTLANGSRIIISATSPDAIRGLSIDVLLLDEFAIIPPKVAEDFWGAVIPTLATRFNNNKNAKLIVASTPKGIGNKFHELVTNAEQGLNDFSVEKAYWYDFPGRDEKWAENEKKSMGLDMFLQEYECTFLNNSGSPFEPSMFDKFEREMIEPINILDNGKYYIWKKPLKDHIYTMGVDTSEGTGQDYSVIQIFDITNPQEIEQVARYSDNKIDTNSWSAKVREIAKQWYDPILLVERNGPGSGPCDRLAIDYSYPRFTNHGTGGAMSFYTKGKIQPGIISHIKTKGPAIINMKYYIHDRRCVKIYDKETINELRTFVRRPTSSTGYARWEAQTGYHDDHVMAMVWALYILHKNIINTWLIVSEKDDKGIPLKIKPRWNFNLNVDYESSLYKHLNSNSNLIPVMGMRAGGKEHGITIGGSGFISEKSFKEAQSADIFVLPSAAQTHQQREQYKPSALEFLLDHAEDSRYDPYRNNAPFATPYRFK